MTRPVLLDTNLLVLLLVGLAAPEQIGHHKRVKRYSLAAFEFLMTRLRTASTILVTPHIVAEASNLLPAGSETAQRRLMAILRNFILPSGELLLDVARDEVHVASRFAAGHHAFLRLGLADAGLLTLPSDAAILLTDDLPLYLEAARTGREVEYFTYTLQEAGLL